ncbi:FtsW/RodA/SpoVE family cell cycle protein [Fructilactobacillus carniphilus]|uniref:Probable peptidoglycan glycosyltransferase FtsW n=1 Tax=Fructilactobacillus carniphilus TaxID=2940297 RepID=A0ABY5BYB3_9LACO|nr:FtsW/RodA/SpoVE family cell cycle protein [Fructilactobacillus carniphilus]USS90923.1 FtsW/RodA/SpoVE family cell cycle protein [Fructilactobacillus carniphilus]
MKKFFKGLDWYLFFPYLLLCGIGIVMVYSSSAGIGLTHGGFATAYLYKQIGFVMIAMVLMFLMYRIKLKIFQNVYFIMALSVILVILLIGVFFISKKINGAAGWINLGPINLQPAELCKFYFIIYFANFFNKRSGIIAQEGLWRATTYNLKPLFLPILILFLVLAQPDTGGFAINLFIIVIMFLAASTAPKLVVGIVSFCLVLPLMVMHLAGSWIIQFADNSSNYKIQRFVSFADPFLHAQSSGQQLINSYYAISNGGLFGRGLGNSIQKMGYLAEPNTDFILPIISEELGLVGVTVILALLFILVARIIKIGIRTTNIYYSTICYGTAAYLMIQTLFNAGGAVGFVPLTGVTLPFISYGGSSIITLSLCLGLVMKISHNEQQIRDQRVPRLRSLRN